jgi:hypothetical protein
MNRIPAKDSIRTFLTPPPCSCCAVRADEAAVTKRADLFAADFAEIFFPETGAAGGGGATWHSNVMMRDFRPVRLVGIGESPQLPLHRGRDFK